MFTGIIETVASLKKIDSQKSGVSLIVKKPKNWKIKKGGSIAVDGACLTVAKVTPSSLHFSLMPETLKKTYWDSQIYSRVNLERALKPSSLVSGHFVLGHIDTVGVIKAVENNKQAKILTISCPKKFSALLVSKGSVAVDGISLTVVDENPGKFTVSLVDYTLDHTTISEKKVGDLVNIEFDVLAKYITRYAKKR